MTSDARPRRGRNLLALAGLLAAAPAACALLQPGDEGPADHPLPFDHAVHAAAGIDCAECHASAAHVATAGLPALATCLECHEDDEAPATKEYLAGIAARPADARWTLFARAREGDVIFSHATHVTKGVACAACHGDVAASKVTGPEVAPSMATCVACHEQRDAQRDCRTCHTDLRTDRAPPSHRGDWGARHGLLVRRGELEGKPRGTCSICHEPDTCTRCHQQVPPRSHTQFFTLRGHGLEAAVDRDSCRTCHEPDSCVRCHQSTPPTSHRGGWGGARSEHCVGCHVPPSRGTCGVCHAGTPSHARATPLPANHGPANLGPGMNCRHCHGVAQRLPHADNGMTCVACHR